jgi:hypothetical protein
MSHYMLDMEASGGGYYSSSDHQWHNGSSRKIKKDISGNKIPVFNILDNLKIRQFHYKSEKKNDPFHIGFIAEETYELLSGKDKNSQSIADCIGFLLAVVKKLKTEIDDLKKNERKEYHGGRES